MHRCLGLLFVLMLSLAQPAAANQTHKDASEKAWEVINRTKNVTSTYSAYQWITTSLPGEPARQDWTAEFHSDNLHRVENSKVRVIADCTGMTGAMLTVGSDDIFSGASVAKAACGINTNKWIFRAEWLGEVHTRFGVADRIKIWDSADIRTYDVTPSGVILWTKYEENSANHPVKIISEMVALLPSLPSDKPLFDAQSLNFSAVADQFRSKPNLPPYER